MYKGRHVSVIIPVLNEAASIGLVIEELQALTLNGQHSHHLRVIDDIIVCDNGSTDGSSDIATEAGARTILQQEQGYGAACLSGLAALQNTDIVLFVDGDHSCVAEQALDLLEAINKGAQLAIGSRALGKEESGALTLPQKFGNQLATILINKIWGQTITDLGPFRAITSSALQRLHMQDRRFGWTVEMQVKAIQLGLDITEVPVDSLKRIGTSKISGTLRGVIGAGLGIIGMIVKLRWHESVKSHAMYRS